jgi:hypothetical protein
MLFVKSKYAFRQLDTQHLLICLVAAVFLILINKNLFSESIKEYQLKAAYLANIPNHVTWPKSSFESPDSPFYFCLLDSGDISDAVKQILDVKEMNGRKILINTEISLIKRCHIIFVDKTNKDLVSIVFSTIEGKDVLTIGDFDEFANSGGMINFYTKDNRVKIAINLNGILETKLKISSKLTNISSFTF